MNEKILLNEKINNINYQESSINLIKDEKEKKLFIIFNLIQDGKVKKGKNIFGDLNFEYSCFPMDTIIYNDEIYYFPNEARIIDFYSKSDGKTNKAKYLFSHFIMNSDYFKKILKQNDIVNYKVLSQSITNIDDDEFFFSIDYCSNIFYDISIKSLLINNFPYILTKENFNKKLIKNFGFNNFKIKDLSLNASKYFPVTAEKNYIQFQEISDYIYDTLKSLEKNKFKKILYFLGSKGSSKSTLLLTFVQYIHSIYENWGSMYFNIRYLNDLNVDGIKNILLKESLYLFSDLNELNNFQNNFLMRNKLEISEPIYTIKFFITEIIKN